MSFLLATLIATAHASERSIRVVTTFWEATAVIPWISEGAPAPYSYLLTPVSADAGGRESEIKVRSEFPALPD